MNEWPARVRVLQLAIVLTAVFDLLSLLVLWHGTPVVFTVFMFVGQSLFGVALILLVWAVLADLGAKQLL